MALECFRVYPDQLEMLETYTNEQVGRLFSAMMDYAFDGVEPTLEGTERDAWPELRRMIDKQK